MRYVGVDFGEKRFGISLSDPLFFTAQGKTVIPAKLGLLLDLLKQYKAQYGVLTVVVGLPLSLKGTDTQTTQKVRKFVADLQEAVRKNGLEVLVETFDERFSTRASEKVLIAADLSRKKRKTVVDALAAAFMLQGYLEKHVKHGI